MASWNARQRDPLLDSATRATLERRGKELAGLTLLALAVLAVLMLGSYSPDDPNWMAATDAPAQNLLGRLGAGIASALFIITGHGAWGVPVVLAAWGLRLALHQGGDRALSRAIFAPIAIAVVAVHAATLVPGPGWAHSFGLGGLFGDTVLGALLGVMPMPPGAGLRAMSVLSGAGAVAMGLYVTGWTVPELRRFGRLLLVGLVMVYAGVLALMGAGMRTALGMGRRAGAGVADRSAALAAHLAERRGAPAAEPPAEPPAEPVRDAPRPRSRRARDNAPAEPPMRRTTPILRAHPADRPGAHVPDLSHGAEDAPPPPAPRTARRAAPDDAMPDSPPHPAADPRSRSGGGLLSLLPDLVRRPAEPAADHDADMVEPELVEPSPRNGPLDTPAEAPSEDRIRARIADVIRSRRRTAPSLILRRPPAPPRPPAPLRPEPPLRATDTPTPEPVPRRAPAPPPAAAVPQPRTPAPAPVLDTAPDEDPAPPLPEPVSEPVSEPLPEPAPRAPAPLARAAAMFAPRKVVQHPARRPPAPSRRAQAEAQPDLRFDEDGSAYELPPLSLLTPPESVLRHPLSDEALEENARMLETVLDDYGVKGEITSVRPGPVVTMYELEPAPGLKASRVIGLADDIARSMSALSARVSTVPGRSVIGIELPNAHREKVVLREILAARDYGDSQMRLPLALGKGIGGEPIIANLAKMPHLLIAGTTGSGKSVAINTMILSLLYRLTPEECRLIMIDPKMLELSVYDGIPHLLSPVVTDPKKAVVALKWVVAEMEDRYRKMSKMGVRNIEGYNGRVREALSRGEMFSRIVQTGFDDETGEPVFEHEEFAPEALPFIVVIVDEMADLMMVAGKEIEACIQRLAQMARASGIHLIMATQRPSVDVITGTIKANFPTRISFQVTSKIDSRTILGEQGAEQLLGQGDMLYMAGGGRITRIHGPFVSDEEVEEIVNHLKSFGPPDYVSGVVEGPDEAREADIDAVLGLGDSSSEDALYDQAVAIVAKDRKCSTSYIQRKLGIGYNKAARLVEQMETNGVVTPANHVGKREILVPET